MPLWARVAVASFANCSPRVLLIALLGGVFGMLLALWGTKALLALAPSTLPRLSGVQLDLRILLLSLGVSLVCGVIFGLVPALTASKTNLVSSLKESERTDSTGATRQWLRRTFVVAEVAIALVLLISAGLLVRSFGKLLDVQPGFDPAERNHAAAVAAECAIRQRDQSRCVLRQRAGACCLLCPACNMPAPLTRLLSRPAPTTRSSLFVAGKLIPAIRRHTPITPSSLPITSTTIGLPILKGRGFQPSDMRAGNYFAPNSVAIIDEELAKRFWPNGDALGGGISWGKEGPWATVVGICATAQLKDLTEQSKGTFYLPAYVSEFDSRGPHCRRSSRADSCDSRTSARGRSESTGLRREDDGRASCGDARDAPLCCRAAQRVRSTWRCCSPRLGCTACSRSPCRKDT